MAPPYYSVVIPTYNRSRTIEPTLLSVQRQTFTDFECVIVDDGSSDTEALLEVISGLNDDRFRVVQRPNGGGGAARNTGIDASTGRFIAFLDSDDIFLPEKLQLTRDAIEMFDDPHTRVIFSQIIVDRGVSKTWIKPSRAPSECERIDEYLILSGGFIQTSTIAVDATVAAKIRFDETLPFGQDTDFCLRLAAHGQEFHMIPLPQVIWKDDTSSGRVSSNRRHEAILAWTDRARSCMSTRSYLVYRGWHGAKAAFGVDRSLAFSLYWQAISARAFSPALALRVAMQIFVPPALYRRFANGIVSAFGNRSGN